jgi:hypothetical protein
MTDMEGRERCRAVTPMGPKMADSLVAYLEQLGVEYVFGRRSVGALGTSA